MTSPASTDDRSRTARWDRWLASARRFGPLSALVGLVAQRTLSSVLVKVGHPGATLDDAYIHFQYARAIAEGHPLQFTTGAEATSGSTSLLWPVLLAPIWALGARDETIVWGAWALSFLAFGGLAWETSRLTETLAGKTAALGAGAMTLTFGGFLWCAASGMEVVPFAWAIARASRRACDWAESEGDARTRRRAAELVMLAWIAALFRPEGAVTAIFVATTLVLFQSRPRRRSLGASVGALCAAGAVPFFLWLFTGEPRSTTAVAKLLPGNPYYVGAALINAVSDQAKLLITKILDGEVWSAEFLPRGGASVALVGLGAVAVLGIRGRARWRAFAVILIALTMFAPCFYLTFLWNRLRYLWPFATGFIVGLACFARLAGDVAGLLRPRFRNATGIICGAFVGLLGSRLDWVIDDIAQSASGIDRQQVALGRWARENLPRDARIGVNDTGAIAYFGERKTFDIVGLTTKGEARYWVSGPASRLEHYEQLAKSAPWRLPTHFIVYPEWMALPFILGPPIHEATVKDSSILGGQTMRVYAADWSRLGSGEEPWTPHGEIHDEVDVADLDSEALHSYCLEGARDGEEVVHDGLSPSNAPVIDGGRARRMLEHFSIYVPQSGDVTGIVRLEGPPGTRITLLAEDKSIDDFELGDSDWVEHSFTIPASVVNRETKIELRVADGSISIYHYWFFESPGVPFPPVHGTHAKNL